MKRREFLKLTATGVLSLAPVKLFSLSDYELDKFYRGDRSLFLERNNKRINVLFYREGAGYIKDGYEELCYFLKDMHEDIAVKMDIELFNVLHFTQKWLYLNQIDKPIVITSGYRTPQTNAKLEKASEISLHMYGKAIDGRVEGVSNLYLASVARRVGGGGIGLYNTHVHIDTGRVRAWLG